MLSSGGRSARQFSKYAFSKSVSTKPYGSSPTHLVRLELRSSRGLGLGGEQGLGLGVGGLGLRAPLIGARDVVAAKGHAAGESSWPAL